MRLIIRYDRSFVPLPSTTIFAPLSPRKCAPMSRRLHQNEIPKKFRIWRSGKNLGLNFSCFFEWLH